MINKIKLNPLKGFQFALLGVSMLIAGCGGSTTVADSPENFSGNFTGTVSNQDGSSSPATLNLIQSSATTGTGDDTVTTVTLAGLLVISPGDECQVSVDISQGTANNNSIIIELGTSSSTTGTGDDAITNITDSGNVALTASGNDLTGNISFIGVINEEDECPRPGGSVIFRR